MILFAILALMAVCAWILPAALVTMPILLPVAEITDFSKQLTVLCFQFGDGTSNLCYPTSGALVAFLMFARIPFNKWLKFIMPFIVVSTIICAGLIIVGAMIGY